MTAKFIENRTLGRPKNSKGERWKSSNYLEN